MNPEVGNIGHGIIGLFVPTVMGSSLNERVDPLPGSWSCLISSRVSHPPFLYSALFLALLVPQTDSLPILGLPLLRIFSSPPFAEPRLRKHFLRHQRKPGSFTTGFGYQVPFPQCLTILVSNFTRDLLGDGRAEVQEG